MAHTVHPAGLSFRKGVFRLYDFFIRPKSADEDSRRREFILNVLLGISIVFSGLSALSAARRFFLLRAAYEGSPPLVLGTVCLFYVFLFMLSRRGHFVIASYILILAYFLPLSYAIFRWGSDLPQALIVFTLLIIMSSVLISTRFSLITAGLIILTIGVVTLGQLTGRVHLDGAWRQEPQTLSDVVVFAFTFAAIALVSWLSNREIEKSLMRARASEAALTKERDLLEVKVEERTAELKRVTAEKMLQLSRFAEFGQRASGFFHDLVSPLNAVSLNLELVNGAAPQSIEAARTHLDHAMNATKRLETFLAAVKKQFQSKSEPVLFSLNEELAQVQQMLQSVAVSARVDVMTDATEEIQIVGNPLAFQQIIMNLIVNAIQAYETAPEDVARREVSVHLTQQENAVRLTVQDWGCGISPENLPKIFEPFFTTKPIKGTGVGLSSCRLLLEKEFNGSIAVSSSPGNGTMFTAVFPLGGPHHT